jgi:hypothetical protein
MPAGDGTGPMGDGPMTGRQMGYCGESGAPGFMRTPEQGGQGMGSGRGRRGGRRGWRHRFHATGLPWWARGQGGASHPAPTAAAEQQPETLKAQVDHLERSLQEMRERITELESARGGES